MFDELHSTITAALMAADNAREEAGQGESGRYLALARTSLEQAESWVLRAHPDKAESDYPSDEETEKAMERGMGLRAGKPTE